MPPSNESPGWRRFESTGHHPKTQRKTDPQTGLDQADHTFGPISQRRNEFGRNHRFRCCPKPRMVSPGWLPNHCHRFSFHSHRSSDTQKLGNFLLHFLALWGIPSQLKVTYRYGEKTIPPCLTSAHRCAGRFGFLPDPIVQKNRGIKDQLKNSFLSWFKS